MQARYAANPAGFVQACHQAGLRVFGMISGLEGWECHACSSAQL